MVGKQSSEEVGAAVGWRLLVGIHVGIGMAQQSPAPDQLLECRGIQSPQA